MGTQLGGVVAPQLQNSRLLKRGCTRLHEVGIGVGHVGFFCFGGGRTGYGRDDIIY